MFKTITTIMAMFVLFFALGYQNPGMNAGFVTGTPGIWTGAPGVTLVVPVNVLNPTGKDNPDVQENYDWNDAGTFVESGFRSVGSGN